MGMHFFGLGFSTFTFAFFLLVCRLKVIRGRWITYILRNLVVHFLRIYIVMVVGTCVICSAAASLSLGFCMYVTGWTVVLLNYFNGPWCVDWICCNYGVCYVLWNVYF